MQALIFRLEVPTFRMVVLPAKPINQNHNYQFYVKVSRCPLSSELGPLGPLGSLNSHHRRTLELVLAHVRPGLNG